MPETPIYGIPYPVPGDAPDVPTHLRAIAERVEAELSRIDQSLASGFRVAEVLRFTSSTTFSLAAYPGLRAVRVRVQAGGGAGGGAATTGSGESSCGSGGGAGGYAESWLAASVLSTSTSVVVGAGGAGASGANGGDGGPSSFGALTAASGGNGGQLLGSSTSQGVNAGPNGGLGTEGDMLVRGGGAHAAIRIPAVAVGGNGGSSLLGHGGRGAVTGSNGNTGTGYGAGGGGARNHASTATARAGGAGSPGIVLVEVYV